MTDKIKIDKDAYTSAMAKVSNIEELRRKATEPFDEAYKAALDKLEQVTGGIESIGACETCAIVIFDNEPYGNLGDAGYTCAEHAPWMSKIIEGWASLIKDHPADDNFDPFETRDDLEKWLAATRAKIAADGDHQVVYNA